MYGAPQNYTAQPKRLIVCCDGTWEDATADSVQPPSNVTRISRALSRYAEVEEDGVKKIIPQIVYYQKGVGTGIGDKIWGGAAGAGLSANIRAAYGFLAENYDVNDKIYFFGFSRGAYTARAIAGLVTDLGILSCRGMDNFTTVYNEYYKKPGYKPYSAEQRRSLGFRDIIPTVEIVGVWDTVGFHDFWFSRFFGEELEYRNTDLSPSIKYAFHALSLDEKRTAFQPTLWHLPEQRKGQELLQVWFSGVHTDVGGGADDPRLSNITLAWMIAQCTKHNQLSFDYDYLFPAPPPNEEPDTIPWATSKGRNEKWGFVQYMEALFLGASRRTPLRYKPLEFTNETIHESIKDRHCCGQATKHMHWPTKVLKSRRDADTWVLPGRDEIKQVAASDVEKYFKGRIRTVHALQVDQI